MILRVFRARAKPGQRAAVERMQVELGVPVVAGKPGLVTFFAAKPATKDGDEFSFITVWKDLESLKRWAGPNWQEAVLPEEEKPFLREVSVAHYEVSATPELKGAAPISKAR